MSSVERLFVGNLPVNIQEHELRDEFSAYGRVQSCEIKFKRSPDTDEIVSTFAFIFINIDGNSLRQCLEEFKVDKFRDRFLVVNVARENFLDKLKREREEAARKNGHSNRASLPNIVETPAHEGSSNNITLPTISTKDDSLSSSDSSSSSEEEEEPTQISKTTIVSRRENKQDEDDLVVRKRSKTFLENGKIKIASTNSGAAIHVIERFKKEVKNFVDDKAKESDKKRMESLDKMKNTYNQQQMAIKQALSKVDSSKSNKIIFDAAPEPPLVLKVITSKKAVKATTKPLFDDDDEDDAKDYGKDFQIKEQYQGERGAQLMKLQSRFKNDKRFDMNEHFLEDFPNGVGEMETTEEPVEENDERKWQYGILESVMGKRVLPGNLQENNKKIKQTMLRYDPTIEDHTKYLAKSKRQAVDTSDKIKKKIQKIEEYAVDEGGVEVSKDQFYNVTDNLATTIMTQPTGFSLLSMFGRSTADAEQPSTKPYKEILLSKSAQKQITDMTNPFKYDSSDDETKTNDRIPKTSADVVKAKPNNTSKKSGAKAKVWHETFFILNDTDERIKDGEQFFLPVPVNIHDADEQQIESKQKEMRNIIKKKIKRSIKSALPMGAKPNRRFRKIARNL